MRVSGRVEGAEQLRDDLEALADRAGDLRPVWDGFKPFWKARQESAFASLPPLSRSTLQRKSGPNRSRPMVATGKLKRATIAHSPVRDERGESAWGIPKGDYRRPLAVMHAHFRRRTRRVVVPPKWEAATLAEYRRLLREHLLKAWG